MRGLWTSYERFEFLWWLFLVWKQSSLRWFKIRGYAPQTSLKIGLFTKRANILPAIQTDQLFYFLGYAIFKVTLTNPGRGWSDLVALCEQCRHAKLFLLDAWIRSRATKLNSRRINSKQTKTNFNSNVETLSSSWSMRHAVDYCNEFHLINKRHLICIL